MAFTHSLNRNFSRIGETISKGISATGAFEINIDESIAAAATNTQLEFALDVSVVRSLYIVCNEPITIKTNSSSAPANTFTLAANSPFAWIYGDSTMRDTAGTAVSTNITSLYVTNPDSSNAVNLQVRCLYGPTA